MNDWRKGDTCTITEVACWLLTTPMHYKTNTAVSPAITMVVAPSHPVYNALILLRAYAVSVYIYMLKSPLFNLGGLWLNFITAVCCVCVIGIRSGLNLELWAAWLVNRHNFPPCPLYNCHYVVWKSGQTGNAAQFWKKSGGNPGACSPPPPVH